VGLHPLDLGMGIRLDPGFEFPDPDLKLCDLSDIFIGV
jgi:hypothetical protein